MKYIYAIAQILIKLKWKLWEVIYFLIPVTCLSYFGVQNILVICFGSPISLITVLTRAWPKFMLSVGQILWIDKPSDCLSHVERFSPKIYFIPNFNPLHILFLHRVDLRLILLLVLTIINFNKNWTFSSTWFYS